MSTSVAVMAPVRRLGELLMDEQWLTREQLEFALAAQALRGGKLGETLTEMRLVPEQRVYIALSAQSGKPFVEPESYPVSDEALRALPKELAVRLRVVPLRVERTGNLRTLLVATSKPDDLRAHDEIAFAAGMKIRVAIATPTAIRRTLARLGYDTEFAWEDVGEMVIER